MILYIICFLGLFAGIIVSHFSKEELGSIKPYLKYAKPLLFGIITGYYLNYIGIHALLALILGMILMVISYIWELKIGNADIMHYIIFSIVLFELEKTALLIFIFSIFTGTQQYHTNYNLSKNIMRLLGAYIYFPILGIILKT